MAFFVVTAVKTSNLIYFLLYDPEDGSSAFLRNAGKRPHGLTVVGSQWRTLTNEVLKLWVHG
jgi:hypothetical protein